MLDSWLVFSIGLISGVNRAHGWWIIGINPSVSVAHQCDVLESTVGPHW